jgi:HSP20 family protein
METLKKLPMLDNRWPMLLSNLFNRDSFNEGNLNFFDQNNATVPAVNIKETNESFAIEMLAPGMAKTDFKIEVDKNQLIVTAEKKVESETGSDNYHRKEFSLQSLRRTFTLAENIVDADKIQAQYSEGILYLTIPKKEEALPKPVKLIEIS